MKYRWSLSPARPLLARQLSVELGISPLLAQCLVNRGLTQRHPIASFLEPRLKHLADPFKLPDMEKAVERLLLARARLQQVVIFGDYDVDGVTSTALLIEVLSRLGWKVAHYLPHRLDEGYGLSRDGVENCLKRLAPSVLLAVDCGSTAVDSIAWLNHRAVDVIVVDHHQVASPPPSAAALVNPLVARSRPVSSQPPVGENPVDSVELCSVGLAFKLAHALVKRGRELGWPGAAEFDLRPLLDLVALGTVADMAPLTGENRILVSVGLERLQVTKRPGLIALKDIAGTQGSLGPYEAGFQLGPRLNAAGRLETAEDALRLLLAADLREAMPIARQLDGQNRERQRIERAITEAAMIAVRSKFNPATDFVIVEGALGWHVGVVGIVASRLLHQFYRPTVVLGGEGGEWRGSGRSIAGFDLAAALRQCSDLLVRHGGHAMAAGLAVREGKLDAFRARLNELARSALQPDQLHPSLPLDAEVGLADMDLETIVHLNRLKPVGQGNAATQFFVRNLALHRPPLRMGGDRQHVKLHVTDGAAVGEAVWWGAGAERLPEGIFDLAFAPQLNEFNGRTTVQLKMLDWRPSKGSPVQNR